MSTEATGFASLKPAIISKATPTDTIETVPGFEPAFKATVSFGADWLFFDIDGEHARIDLRAIAKTAEGHAIDFRYYGVIALSGNAKNIIDGAADAKTIPFGCMTGSVKFLVSDASLKFIENNVFATNARIIVHEAGLTVETRVSLVVASTDID